MVEAECVIATVCGVFRAWRNSLSPSLGGEGYLWEGNKGKIAQWILFRIEKRIKKQECKQKKRQVIITESRILREAHRCTERDKENRMMGYSERVFPHIAFVLNLTLLYLSVAAVYSASILL